MSSLLSITSALGQVPAVSFVPDEHGLHVANLKQVLGQALAVVLVTDEHGL